MSLTFYTQSDSCERAARAAHRPTVSATNQLDSQLQHCGSLAPAAHEISNYESSGAGVDQQEYPASASQHSADPFCFWAT
jgi:hypothetical protein